MSRKISKEIGVWIGFAFWRYNRAYKLPSAKMQNASLNPEAVLSSVPGVRLAFCNLAVALGKDEGISQIAKRNPDPYVYV